MQIDPQNLIRTLNFLVAAGVCVGGGERERDSVLGEVGVLAGKGRAACRAGQGKAAGRMRSQQIGHWQAGGQGRSPRLLSGSPMEISRCL